MTVEQIMEETRRLPRDQLAELVDRLTVELHQGIDPGVEDAWRAETRRRVAEIESGRAEFIPGEEVMAELRRIVGR